MTQCGWQHRVVLCLALWAACSGANGQSTYVDLTQKSAPVAATTAHPLATDAALKMLQQGGSAVDAAIAAQLMLGLVESQSSGLGGGGFLMHWDARQKSLTSFDGLAAAPQKVTASLTTDVDGSRLPYAAMGRGGRSAGVPGTLPLLAQVHAKFGKLPWHFLFTPAIEAAANGFPMPAYMHQILSAPTAAQPASTTSWRAGSMRTGSKMFSRTGRYGIRLNIWNTYPRCRARNASRAPPDIVEKS